MLRLYIAGSSKPGFHILFITYKYMIILFNVPKSTVLLTDEIYGFTALIHMNDFVKKIHLFKVIIR